MAENVILKRCPFCGGEADFIQDRVLGLYAVWCKKCKCQTTYQFDFGAGLEVSKRKAAEVWNQRPSGAWSWISDTSPMCSACGHVFDSNDNADAGTSRWKFCPACGVRMDRKG